jgi:integrase
MGYIYRPKYKDKKTGDAKESAVWWIKYHRGGKPYRESAKSTKETKARTLLKKREGEVADGKLPGFYFDRVIYKELAETFVNDRLVNKGLKSKKDAEKRLRNLDSFFEGEKVVRITTPRINKYIETRLEAGAENGTINRELAALKRMLNLGAKETPPRVNRVPYIPMLEEDNVRSGFFEPIMFDALQVWFLEHAPEYVAFIVFGYMTGWRYQEAAGLTWDRVDLDNGIIRLNAGTTKNKKARSIKLEKGLLPYIQEQLEKKIDGCPFVFHLNGKRIGDVRAV